MKTTLVAASLMASTLCFAESTKPVVVVLDFEAKGATALQVDAAQQGVARGLRDLDVFQVMTSKDVRELLALERSKELTGASTSGGDFARVLGSEHVVAGTVTALGTSLQVELRLLDTAKNVVMSQKVLGPLANIEQLAAQLPASAQELMAPLLREQQGSLVVQAKEEGAEVLVDDVLVGSVPMRKPIRLSRGMHRVQVRKDGFIAETRLARITAEQVTSEPFTLVPSADYAEAFRQRYGKLRIGAYVTTAVAILALGGAVWVDRGLSEPLYESQFLPRRYALAGVAQSDLPSSIQNDRAPNGSLSVYQQCGATPTRCGVDMNNISGQLTIQQVVTLSLAVIGIASSGTALYLWLSGQDPNRYSGLIASIDFGRTPGFVLGFRF